MTVPISQCLMCRHCSGFEECPAFSDKIPVEIWLGDFNHTVKHPDQINDIMFELAVEFKNTITK